MTHDDEKAMEASLPDTDGGREAAYRAGYRDCHAREAAKRERQ
jgi:hypothetical protein